MLKCPPPESLTPREAAASSGSTIVPKVSRRCLGPSEQRPGGTPFQLAPLTPVHEYNEGRHRPRA